MATSDRNAEGTPSWAFRLILGFAGRFLGLAIVVAALAAPGAVLATALAPAAGPFVAVAALSLVVLVIDAGEGEMATALVGAAATAEDRTPLERTVLVVSGSAIAIVATSLVVAVSGLLGALAKPYLGAVSVLVAAWYPALDAWLATEYEVSVGQGGIWLSQRLMRAAASAQGASPRVVDTAADGVRSLY